VTDTELEREMEAQPVEPAVPARPIRALFKQTLVYGVSGVFLQIVGVITVPIYARQFTPSDYGVLELGMVALAVALAVADLGLSSGSQRIFFEYADEAERRNVLLTGLTAALAISTVLALAAIATRNALSDRLFGDTGHTEIIVFAAASVPVGFAAIFAREVMRLYFRAWHYVASAALAASMTAGVGIILVVAFHSGVKGVFVGVLVGHGVAALYGLAVIGEHLRGRLVRRDLHAMLSFGLPLVPTAVAMWAITFIDRVLLRKLTNLGEVGQYAVASRVSGALTLGIVGFQLALSPFILSIYSRDPEAEKVVRAHVLKYLTVALSFAGLVLTLFARELLAVVAPGYHDAYRPVGLLVLAVVAYGIASVVMSGISLARRTMWFALISGVAALLNVAACFALIPSTGMIGAALASVVGFGFLAAAYYGAAQRLYPTPYEPRPTLTTLALASALAPAGLLELSALVAVPLKLGVLVAFVGLLRVTNVVTGTDVREARQLVTDGLGATRARIAT
jgi:O-antigen/teichoic acid export membrane protein